MAKTSAAAKDMAARIGWEALNGMRFAHPDDMAEALDAFARERTALLTAALTEIASIQDPATGDRGPSRRARHVAKCALAGVSPEAPGGET